MNRDVGMSVAKTEKQQQYPRMAGVMTCNTKQSKKHVLLHFYSVYRSYPTTLHPHIIFIISKKAHVVICCRANMQKEEVEKEKNDEFR